LEASITNAHHGASRARVDGRAATLQCHARPQCSAQLQRHGPRSSRRLAPCTSDHVTVGSGQLARVSVGYAVGPTARAHRAAARAPTSAGSSSSLQRRGTSQGVADAVHQRLQQRESCATAERCRQARNNAKSARRGARPRGKRRTAMHVAGTGMRMRSSQLAARARGIRPAGNSRPASWARTHARAAASKRAAAAQVVLGRAAPQQQARCQWPHAPPLAAARCDHSSVPLAVWCPPAPASGQYRVVPTQV
jgi:hypothetical protein